MSCLDISILCVKYLLIGIIVSSFSVCPPQTLDKALPICCSQISSYSEIMEVQRERLGLQIDQLSTEILDNARKSNDMSQSLVSIIFIYLSLSRDGSKPMSV